MTDEVKKAANAVAEDMDARVFVYSGPIDNDGFSHIVRAMQPSENPPHRVNSLLVLTTQGGDAGAAYKIARLFQETSQIFTIFVPAKCKSAGTLIALGASKLVMAPAFSELGPLDVQLLQRDEIGQRRSGMVVRTALRGLSAETFDVFQKIMLGIKVNSNYTISLEMASRIAAQIATGVMTPVYAQINPEVLGNDLRDLNVAKAYGNRLVEHGKNATSTTVKRLVEEYPAHGFIIDKAEASRLFKSVDDPSPALLNLRKALSPYVYTEQRPHYVMRVDQKEDMKNGESDGTADNQEDASSMAGRRETNRGSISQGSRARKTSNKPERDDK